MRWSLGDGPQPEAYAAGHIPGARFVDLDADLAGTPGPGGRHPLPDPDAFGATMRRCGVSSDSEVVAYDGGMGAAAARLWWLLRWCGHERCAVLQGGWRAWIAAGLPIDTTTPPAADGDFEARPGSMPVVDAAGAARVAERGLLLDVRSPERFRGESEPIDPVAGHIPGAVNAPPGHLPEVPEGTEVAAYCGSGITASLKVLELELRGVRAALYPGSWSEWIQDSSRPVATGA